jgi:hypothetical protein
MLRGGCKNERYEYRVSSVDPNVHFGMVFGHMPLPLRVCCPTDALQCA